MTSGISVAPPYKVQKCITAEVSAVLLKNLNVIRELKVYIQSDAVFTCTSVRFYDVFTLYVIDKLTSASSHCNRTQRGEANIFTYTFLNYLPDRSFIHLNKLLINISSFKTSVSGLIYSRSVDCEAVIATGGKISKNQIDAYRQEGRESLMSPVRKVGSQIANRCKSARKMRKRTERRSKKLREKYLRRNPIFVVLAATKTKVVSQARPRRLPAKSIKMYSMSSRQRNVGRKVKVICNKTDPLETVTLGLIMAFSKCVSTAVNPDFTLTCYYQSNQNVEKRSRLSKGKKETLIYPRDSSHQRRSAYREEDALQKSQLIGVIRVIMVISTRPNIAVKLYISATLHRPRITYTCVTCRPFRPGEEWQKQHMGSTQQKHVTKKNENYEQKHILIKSFTAIMVISTRDIFAVKLHYATPVRQQCKSHTYGTCGTSKSEGAWKKQHRVAVKYRQLTKNERCGEQKQILIMLITVIMVISTRDVTAVIIICITPPLQLDKPIKCARTRPYSPTDKRREQHTNSINLMHLGDRSEVNEHNYHIT